MNALTLLAPTPDSPAEWAQRISAAYRQCVEDFIETGRLLIAAKEALPHGEFTPMIETQLPFGERTAQRLMAIAEHPWLSNPTHASLLPADWTAVYELSRLTPEALQARVADGTIRPDMARGEAIKGRLESRRILRLGEMRDLAANPLALPAGPFAAGIADPPWENPDAPIGFTNRHYRTQYPTMTPAQVAAMPVARMFAATAFLGLWITRHHLAIGAHLAVLEAWDFTPNTIVTWDKEWIGLGNGYVRDRTEHLVLATRGKPAAPGSEARPDSIFSERRSNKHSEKPARIHEWIETWFPQMSYVELFARPKPRENWVFWGNQATVETEPPMIDITPPRAGTTQRFNVDPATIVDRNILRPATPLDREAWERATKSTIAEGDKMITNFWSDQK